jgi:hypothetical protein
MNKTNIKTNKTMIYASRVTSWVRLQLKSYGVSGSPGAADSDPLINRRMNARIGIRATHNRSTVKKIHSFLTDST